MNTRKAEEVLSKLGEILSARNIGLSGVSVDSMPWYCTFLFKVQLMDGTRWHQAASEDGLRWNSTNDYAEWLAGKFLRDCEARNTKKTEETKSMKLSEITKVYGKIRDHIKKSEGIRCHPHPVQFTDKGVVFTFPLERDPMDGRSPLVITRTYAVYDIDGMGQLRILDVAQDIVSEFRRIRPHELSPNAISCDPPYGTRYVGDLLPNLTPARTEQALAACQLKTSALTTKVEKLEKQLELLRDQMHKLSVGYRQDIGMQSKRLNQLSDRLDHQFHTLRDLRKQLGSVVEWARSRRIGGYK